MSEIVRADEGSRPSTTEATRADRMRRRISDHPIGSKVVVVAGLVAALGATIGGVRQIVGLVDGSPDRPTLTAPVDEYVRLAPSELKTARNARYGFSMQYPASWTRQDPINGDGLAAVGPEPGFELLTYGGLPVLGPQAQDGVFERLDYLVRQQTDHATRVVEEDIQQNIVHILPDGQTAEVAGRRFVMETDGSEGRPGFTTVALVTTTGDRDVQMTCRVPTELYQRWEGACNQLLSGLTLTR
jgi:hypothetical protein